MSILTNKEALRTALNIAIKAHDGVFRRDGEPYIFHPIRVMENVKNNPENLNEAEHIEAMVVALLHDVVEDSDTTSEDLREAKFNDAVVSGVISVTKRSKEPYMQFIKRANRNKIGRVVKLADIKDNFSIDNLKKPTIKDFERQRKYRRAMEYLYGAQQISFGLNHMLKFMELCKKEDYVPEEPFRFHVSKRDYVSMYSDIHWNELVYDLEKRDLSRDDDFLPFDSIREIEHIITKDSPEFVKDFFNYNGDMPMNSKESKERKKKEQKNV